MYVLAFALDVYGASANVTFPVIALQSPSFNSSLYFQQSLKTKLLSGDVDGIFQTINLVSSTLSAVNCSAAPNCTAFNRNACLDTINTCASCFDGFKGIIGDDNSKCFPEGSTAGSIGSSCKKNTDCLFNYCAHGRCAAPSQTCESASLDTICSEHGSCVFTDNSRNIVKNCTILDPFCNANCVCRSGYGGVDCSLDPLQLAERSTTRSGMCGALLNIIAISDRSAKLFDTIASALLSAYDGTQIITAAGKVECSTVVRFLGTLASKGYLKGTLPSTPGVYHEISSQFVGTGVKTQFAATAGTPANEATRFSKDVITAVKGITQGTIETMVQGQVPVTLVTANIRAVLTNDLLGSLANTAFSPPRTTAESFYGSNQPKIFIVGSGLSSCSDTSGYAQLSTLSFGTNPHSGSDAIQTPLLQFSSQITTKVPIVKKTLTHAADYSSALVADSISITNHTTGPKYFVTLQFSTAQKFNLSIQGKTHYDKNLNVTLPACRLYNSVTAKYVNCANCNISSYTQFNATFACYNLRNLCPTTTSTKKKVVPADYHQQIIAGRGYDRDFDGFYHTGHSWTRSAGTETNAHNTDSRQLEDTDDYTPTDDDGPAGTDDEFTSKNQATGSEFGSILSAIAAELASVLSQNPFAIDLTKATPVLSFVGAFSGFIIIGLIYFLRWDKRERHQAVYLLEEKLSKSRDKIKKDLNAGGNGLINEKRKSYEPENVTTVIQIINRSFVNLSHGRLINTRPQTFSELNTRDPFVAKTRAMEEEEYIDPIAPTVLIAEFTDQVIPGVYSLNKGELHFDRGKYKANASAWADSFHTLRKTHYISGMLYGSSMRTSRTLRFLEMVRIILLGIFIDTLIYGVYFPSDATCTAFLTKKTCLLLPSKVNVSSTPPILSCPPPVPHNS